MTGETQKLFASLLAGQIRPPYRGDLWENARHFKLVGKAYESMPAEQNGYFDIRTARHLEWPARALIDHAVRQVFIIGAIQVLKSVLGDLWVAYIMEHIRRNTLVLFEDDPKADLYASVRLMDVVRHHPVIKGILEEVKKENRHNVAGTYIKTPGMDLLVAGLNDGNVSSLSWPLIWISEAWQHKSDGLLMKAIKRADRFPYDSKVLCESQAGLAGEDLHRQASIAHQVSLTWSCPACGGRSTFEPKDWFGKRPDDFVPREPAHREGWTPPKPNTHCGMMFGPSEVEGKTLTIEERARASEWECYHCGHRIADTIANRQTLMDTYEADYRIGKNGSAFSPAKVCFFLPYECARDNSFAKTVEKYLVAKAAKDQGNAIPLQDWYLQDRAVFYDDRQTVEESQLSIGSWDVNILIKDEHSRNMAVDVQKKLGQDEDVPGSFWVIAEIVDKNGNSFEESRMFCTDKQEWIDEQHRLKIPNARVVIDGRKWGPTVMQWAADHFEWADATLPWMRGKKYRSCWRVLLGDDAPYYRWGDKQSRAYGPPMRHEKFIIENGRPVAIPVFSHLWSNTAVKDQLHTIIIGGEGLPKIHACPREKLNAKTRAKEVGDLTYENQMRAEYRTIKRGRPFWDKKRPGNHYWDVRCMLTVRKMMDGLLGTSVADPMTIGGQLAQGIQQS